MPSPEKFVAVVILMLQGLTTGWLYHRRGKGSRVGMARPMPSMPYAARLHRITNLYVGTILLFSLNPNLPDSVLLLFHHNAWVRWSGIAVATSAITLFFWAMNTLGDQYSPCGRVFLPEKIVKAGPYRWFRHPVYLGIWFFMLGTLLTTGSLWMLGPLTLYAIAFSVQANREECQLSESLPEYRIYQQQTRWLA